MPGAPQATTADHAGAACPCPRTGRCQTVGPTDPGIPSSTPARGQLAEFAVPTGEHSTAFPFALVSGLDGALWFTEGQTNKIGRITPAGALTEFPVPTADSFPTMLALGPDGNLWFTEGDGGKIGRITPRGAVSEHPLATPGS